MSLGRAYKLRRSPGAEGFAAVWDAEGRIVGRETRYNDRLLMFLLRAPFRPLEPPGQRSRARRGG